MDYAVNFSKNLKTLDSAISELCFELKRKNENTWGYLDIQAIKKNIKNFLLEYVENEIENFYENEE